MTRSLSCSKDFVLHSAWWKVGEVAEGCLVQVFRLWTAQGCLTCESVGLSSWGAGVGPFTWPGPDTLRETAASSWRVRACTHTCAAVPGPSVGLLLSDRP